jgi:hypothetical protein
MRVGSDFTVTSRLGKGLLCCKDGGWFGGMNWMNEWMNELDEWGICGGYRISHRFTV